MSSISLVHISAQSDTALVKTDTIPAISVDSINLLTSKAVQYFEHGFFHRAADYFELLQPQLEEDYNLKVLYAQNLYETGNFRELKPVLNFLLDSIEVDRPELLKLRASVHHYEYEFERAAEGYKKYLIELEDDLKRREAAELIRRAANGLMVPGRRIDLLVENMGPYVNTEADEMRPLFSPNIRERIYFSSNREGSTGIRVDEHWEPDSIFGRLPMDMYQAELTAGNFRNVELLNPDLSSPLNDIVLDFSGDGRVVYHFRGFSENVGRVFVDTFGVQRDDPIDPRFISPFVPELGDQGLSFVNDTTILFSSRRPGGYGGYDLYMALFRDGEWTGAVNLGPEINGPYDELDPFMTAGGKELFFSSNRLANMGEIDIYHSTFNTRSRTWRSPEGIGLPINSAGSDRYFQMSNDGKTCVFSSNRKGGYGGYDIYLAYFRNEWEDQFESFSDRVLERYFPRPPVSEVPQFILPPDSLLTLPLSDTLDGDSEAPREVKEEPLEEPEVDTAVTEELEEEPEPEAPLLSIEELVAPLFYDEGGLLRYDENAAKVRELSRFLLSDTTFRIQLDAFSANAEPIHRDLFFSVKKAEEIALELISQGVSRDRITIAAYGSAYPLARNELGGSPHFRGRQLNQRVEVLLIQGEEVMNAESQLAELKEGVALKEDYFNFRSTASGLYFKVQIGASETLFSHDLLTGADFPMVERNMDSNFYRYTIALKKTVEDIRSFRKELELAGAEGIFVVPFLKGRRLAMDEVEQFREVYEELKALK